MSGMLDPTKVQAQINAAATCAAVDDIVDFVTNTINDIVAAMNAQKAKLLSMIASSDPVTFIANFIATVTTTINEIVDTITTLQTLLTNLTTWAGIRKAFLGC